MIDRAKRIAANLLERAQNITRNREGALIDEATFGAQCAQMLDSEPFRVFLAKTENRLTDELLKVPNDRKGDDERRHLAIAIQVTRQFGEFLIKSAQSGRVAEAELDKLRKGRERTFR